jgi:hypothetical protein
MSPSLGSFVQSNALSDVILILNTYLQTRSEMAVNLTIVQTRTGENVRLFTYATVIFLPLSFSTVSWHSFPYLHKRRQTAKLVTLSKDMSNFISSRISFLPWIVDS